MIKTTIALALAAALVGCATLRADRVKFDTAFAACVKSDVPSSGSAAVTDAEAIVIAGLANWEAELDAQVLKLGAEAVHCTLLGLEAALGTSPVPNTAAIARSQAYRAKLITSGAVAVPSTPDAGATK